MFGNGGSSTDAASLASLFVQPPWGQSLPARNLVDDSAVLTALGNDVGFDLVFSRQLIAHADADDIAIGLSTSGNSRNLLHAFAEAARRGTVDDRYRRATQAARWRSHRTCSTAWSSTPTVSIGYRRRRLRLALRCGKRCSRE